MALMASLLVDVIEPAGSDTFVATTIGGAECVARMRADTDVVVGQNTTFAVNDVNSTAINVAVGGDVLTNDFDP